MIAGSLHAAPSPGADIPTDTFLRDFAETRRFMLGRPAKATPTADGKTVLFLRAKSAREPSQELFAFDIATGQTRKLLSPDDALKGASEELSPEEKARRERQRISVGGFTAFSTSKDSALVLLSLSDKLYVLRIADRSVRELATGQGTIVDPKFAPDSKSVAYVRNHDVYAVDLETGMERAVTSGGTEVISHGLAEFVAQEEMARFSGYWWSPDSQRIAFEESDTTRVETWYAADPAQPGNTPEKTYYPRPGKENAAVRVGIASLGAQAGPIWLDWDRTCYPYLGSVSWSENGPLTLTVLTRDQTELALLKADPATGKTEILLAEHDPAWVNVNPQMPRWLSSKDGGGFLWTSERAGAWQLERRGTDGAPGAVLVPPDAGYVSFAGVAGGRAYYVANPDRAKDRIASVGLGGDHADARVWTDTDDLHGATLGEDNQAVLIDVAQGVDRMPRATVRRLPDGEPIGELPSIAIEPPFRLNATYEQAGDRDHFSCVVVRPRNFDASGNRKYPVIVDVYGGPGAQQALPSMLTHLLDQWLADQGFVVVLADGRGTPGRGRDWERAIAGHFGSVPLEDQVAALRALGASHAELDLDRVGITGWSFGGYMAALAVLRRPDVFKAAVAGAPVTDWMDYDTCYTERYLGVPGAGRWPNAYTEGSLLTYASQLSRPLLIIHGTADDNVYLRHSLKLIDALFRAGLPVDFLPLSSLTHMVPVPIVRSRLEERIARYFQTHLAP